MFRSPEVFLPIDVDWCERLFTAARTHVAWQDRPVPDHVLRQLYDIARWGATSSNCGPARFVFVRSPAAKERLRPFLAKGNVDKTMSAPVTVIVAYDLTFYEKLPKLMPHKPALRALLSRDPSAVQMTALRDSTLQGAYLMLTARGLGLDCGPMSGFDNARLDAEFFRPADGSSPAIHHVFPESTVRSNFLCNLGYGDSSKLPPRNPRLDFSEACQLL